MLSRSLPSHPVPSRRAIFAIGACALAVVWLIVGTWIGQVRTLGRDAAAREIGGFATLLSDHTERTIQGVDLLLSLLASRLEFVLSGARDGRTGALHAILSRDVAGMPQIRRAFLIDAEGWVVADSQFPEPRAFSAADRPHFLVHRDDAAAGLYVSEPIQSRVDGDWSIVLSRRLNDRDGRFLGVVVATLRPEYFTEIFRESVDVRDTKVVLWRQGGVVMATGSPEEAPAIGARFDIPADSLPGQHGQTAGRSPVFDIERISAYARSSGYPTMVVVTRPLSAIHGATADSERMILAAGVVVSLLVVGIGWMFARQLRSLDFRFRDGIERMSDGFILWDDADRLVVWNSQVTRLFPAAVPLLARGIRLRDLLEGLIARTRPELTAAERDSLVAQRLEVCESTEPMVVETADAKTIEVRVSRTALGGKVTIMRDLTELKRNEIALERALKIEREANELHRRFVTMASHEFRTPLAVIDGAAQRLLGRGDDNDGGNGGGGGADKLERIRNAVRSMTMLIDRTLSSARLEAGTISIERHAIDLSVVVANVCERQRQISPGFAIACDLPAEALMVEGDARFLEQAFANLVSNAVKYSGRSRRIEVTARRVDDAGPSVRVDVGDYGVGIPPDEVDKLFTRFYRASTSNGIAGTGIGLHLTRELVHLHGGRVEVESRLGEGTTFTVTLPCADGARRADAA